MGAAEGTPGGPLFEGMGSLFRGKKNVNKKKRRKIDERPGEQEADEV